ncbi:MAG: hypothetical protein E6I62_00040, partial [Chloroflexi bacterium]
MHARRVRDNPAGCLELPPPGRSSRDPGDARRRGPGGPAAPCARGRGAPARTVRLSVAASAPRAVLLSIGSELLLGETLDSNAAYLGHELAMLGVELRAVHQLPDDRTVIAEAFAAGLATHDLVFATGGLGPTHDDLTREGLADA